MSESEIEAQSTQVVLTCCCMYVYVIGGLSSPFIWSARTRHMYGSTKGIIITKLIYTYMKLHFYAENMLMLIIIQPICMQASIYLIFIIIVLLYISLETFFFTDIMNDYRVAFKYSIQYIQYILDTILIIKDPY